MAKQSKRNYPRPYRRSAVVWILLLLLALFVYRYNPEIFDGFFEDDAQGSSSVTPSEAGTPQSSAPVTLPEDGAVMQLHFLDIGQGDSQLIKIPTASGDFHMLIDTGEYQHANTLIDYLDAQGITKLDAVIATHPHADHMGSMAKIIRNFKIGHFYMPILPDDQTPTTKAYETMLDALIEKRVSVQGLAAGTYIDAPIGAKIEVLSPEKEVRHEDINNYSAVFRLTYGETSFLFTGDAEREAENQMLESESDLSAQLLKVGHHGSSSSTTAAFLEAVSPQYAVISCAEDNQYGHPHHETLQVLEEFGVELLRTDSMQTIIFESDGKTLSYRTGEPSARQN